MRTRTTLLALTLAITFPAAAQEKAPAKAAADTKPAATKPGKAAGAAAAATDKKKDPYSADSFAGLELRDIGPAVTSGRIGDLAIDPVRKGTYYVAVASGGVWKTTNWGTTFEPVFDSEGSFSIGCVTLDPTNTLVVWVGTGENNSQRSVGFGDGVYRSSDGGKTWENVGLKASEHIGKILVHPKDGKTVYVAAQGPLWADGGDRGLYKTTDGGKTWKAVLTISDKTGVSDVWMDPRDPEVLYAAAYQRRRHVFTLINGGPESGIHKSTDGGATWTKLTNGLPKGDVGRIGLAIPPAAPDTVYALVEARGKDGGFYRSLDGGMSWERRGEYATTSAQYYQELVPDPKDANRVYSMDTYMQVTDDGGKTWRKAGEKAKHVDNHALWIDPENTDHLLNGNDGGIYESWDRCETWQFKTNLPVAQFYRVAVDDAKPFYNVYGGTQDNTTLGGPSRTDNVHGILNENWFVTQGGDGFFAAIEPGNPDIVYSEAQHGALVRFDRKTGEQVDIQPQAGPNDAALRWNWDSPLIISPHSPTRLWFAAQRIFRSEDRGNSWKAVSPDLTRQVDRNRLPVMGRVWSVDAVAKNASTSFFGNIVSLVESPKKADLVYAGTDDGLVQVTEDGGGSWRKVASFPGVPEMTYVADLAASPHEADAVYAAFDNHKRGDFKPYLLKSADRGKSWTSIAGDLPARGTVYTVAEDPKKPGLLYCGTEFGLFFTHDGGKKWVQLKGGMPTINVRDLAFQERENDLVVATFGRGFRILDDVTPLRLATPETLAKEATLFPVRDAWAYVPRVPYGLKGKAFLGESFYTAANPPFGAVFTTYLKEDLKGRKKARQEAEKEKAKKGEDVLYPTWADLRAEDREQEPSLLLTVVDETGNVVRRLTAPAKAGFARIAWDLRTPAANPTQLKEPEEDPWSPGPRGPMVAPGTYRVSLSKKVDGVVTPLGEPQSFAVVPLGASSLGPVDRAAVLAFSKKTARVQRAALGAVEAAKEAKTRIDHLEKALLDTPAAGPELLAEARRLRIALADLDVVLNGDSTLGKRNEPALPGLVDRVQTVVSGHWSTTTAPTATQEREVETAASGLETALATLRSIVKDLSALEAKAEAAGAPWTPGRIPELR
ncbi:MAG: glycosyl hydrolase [Holophagales bacterium]|nr:glycosyl hydrolase [Holophagales bacterium]